MLQALSGHAPGAGCLYSAAKVPSSAQDTSLWAHRDSPAPSPKPPTVRHSLLPSVLPRAFASPPQVSVTLATSSILSIVYGETQSNEQDPKDPMKHHTGRHLEKSVGFIKSLCIHSMEEMKTSVFGVWLCRGK